MKMTRRFFTYLLALVLVFGTFNPGARADELLDGIDGYILSDPDGVENVYANYNKETKVLTISGFGHIVRNRWFDMLDERCADYFAMYGMGNTTIKFEPDAGKQIYLPQNSKGFFSNFGGDIEGLNDLNISEVTNMRDMFYGTSKFNKTLTWDTSNVVNMSYMFYGSNYNKEINFNIDRVSDIEQIVEYSLIRKATFNNAAELENTVIRSNGLDTLTIYGLKANNSFINTSGSYFVQKQNNDAWETVGELNNIDDLYEITDDGDYRLIKRNDKIDIRTCTITYNVFNDYNEDTEDFDSLEDIINLEVKNSEGELLESGVDYHFIPCQEPLTYEVSMLIMQGYSSKFNISGIGDYTGNKNLSFFIMFDEIGGMPAFEEVNEAGHKLSEIELSQGSLEFSNLGEDGIMWLNEAIESGEIYIEQGKEYWYVAQGDVETEYNPFEMLVATVIPWPADEEPEPEPGNGIIGGDIIPANFDEIADNEVPQASPTFEDVPADNMYFEAVEYLHEQGIIEGVTETMFMPNMATSRAVTATVLYRMAGKPEIAGNQTLSDVMPEHWFYTPVTWGVEKGVIEGYDDGTYKPDVKLSKEQIVTMLHRYASTKEGMNMDADYDISVLEGYDMLEPYAMEAMKWAYKQGIVEGNKICPKKEVTRGELADMLMKFMKK